MQWLREIKNATVAEVLEPSFPLVAFDTPVERLSHLINKENGAVLAKDEAGSYHIVTKYDVIQSLGNWHNKPFRHFFDKTNQSE